MVDIGKLIEEVKRAYVVFGRVPSRGVKGGCGSRHASAEGILRREAELLHGKSTVHAQSTPWQDGFIQGFEWSNGKEQWAEFVRGFDAGAAVADAVFSWREMPRPHDPQSDSEVEQEMKFIHRDMLQFMERVNELTAKMEAAGIDVRGEDYILKERERIKFLEARVSELETLTQAPPVG